MNSAGTGGKKPALCRYFANSGTCFYGEDCQFLHESPRGVRKSPMFGSPSHSPAGLEAGNGQVSVQKGANGDQFFNATFSTASNGIPEVQTYRPLTAGPQHRIKGPRGSPMHHGGMIRGGKGGIPGPHGGVLPPSPHGGPLHNTRDDSSINSMPHPYAATMSVANHAGGAGDQFLGTKTTAAVRLTHSASTPSFPSYAQLAALDNSTNNGASPVDSPGLSPRNSPMLNRRSESPAAPLDPSLATSLAPPAAPGVLVNNPQALAHEDVGGTTYFYRQEDLQSQYHGMSLPNFTMYPGILPHVAHMKPKSSMPSFFMPDELKMEILNQHAVSMAQIDVEHNPEIPQEVDNYQHLFPLEPPPVNPMHKSCTFGYQTTCYKASNTKDGLLYCLRRIHGFRLVNTKCMALIDLWKKIQHANLVQLREVFTTKAFGDHSMVFVYDYHPCADTLMSRHFASANPSHLNGYASPYNIEGTARPFSAGKGASGPRQHQGLLAESLIWSYVVQLSSSLRTIHANGLACRVLDPTKVLLTNKSRIRLNCLGIFDVLSFDSNQNNPLALMQHYQQEDLVSLGKVVLALACNSLVGIQRDHLQASLDLVSRNYSADLKNLILYLLTNTNRLRSVNDIMPMIGARFYTQLDAANLRNDVIENELSKEVENGRLFRLLAKLGVINERPEFNLDPAWSETGDRYMLKLFRDYLFHQVDDSGVPWVDMAHVIQCINKLDAGVPEKICLMSRDEQNVLVVSYAELKQCYETAFSEVVQASQEGAAAHAATFS